MKIITKEVKKIYNKTNKVVGNNLNEVKKSFVFEVGVGVGVGGKVQLGPINGEIIASKTMNIGISDGKGYESTTTSAGIDMGIKSTDLNVGISTEISHINDKIESGNWEHNNPMVMPWEVWDCPNTKKSLLIETTYEEYNQIEVTDENVFIGISIDAYLIVGGHIKIGFEF